MRKDLTVGSLFSGIGGFDLGLERCGFEIKWQVEIDPYAVKVLTKHWPNVPKYGDIRAIDWGTVEPVDVLCGGFPCQDLSFAGKRAGIDGERSGLWSEYVRAIRALRPRYIIVENVPGLLTNAYMGRVLGDLAESGYDAEWECIPACSVGANHRRDRVWIMAHTNNKGQRQRCTFTGGRAVPKQFADWWAVEPNVGRMAYGIPKRVDRLRGLGNAVVPQIVEWIGRRIRATSEVARG